ncbi:MAG: Na(+)-translocating NADH-quinone reductase subunit C [Desulfobulbus propionicus]|nr:MAG: Na(+)-translocating NADH-quinone reductase subunit C [Desulfobulbus propionicus]PIE63867.1 MAG: Na(+)-translocating NADH-quinone reductase subunit C [Desulfobacterales bacterium]
MAEESALKPFYSVLVLAFVCSALVAGAAVGLRPLQEKNRQLDQKKNILRAAGILEANIPVEEQFKVVEPRLIELTSGNFVAAENRPPAPYNQVQAAFTNDLGRPLKKEADLARITRVEKFSYVYLIFKEGELDQIILPVRGKGLWSTMFAYVALNADLNSIRGISFYAHGETPGLGGEIENRSWQRSWENKQVYDDNDTVRLQVVKGSAAGEHQKYQVDGLSGATMTSTGVSDLMQFWFGEHGFKPFIKRMREKENANG